MKEAQKKALQKCYALREAEVEEYSEELRGTPLDDTREVVNREGLKIVCFEIAKRAVLIGLLHQAEDLSAETLEECMIDIFDLVKDVQWNAHRAQSKAGLVLSSVIAESVEEFTDCALHLLRCTIGYGPDGDENEVTRSALKVLNFYESTVATVPLTNTAAIGSILELHESRIREILDVYETFKLARPSSEYDYEMKEQRIVAAAMRVVSGTAPVIEELSRAVKEWNDSDVSESTITNMENLAVMTSLVLIDINKMKGGYLRPPMEVSNILECLDRMNDNVMAMQEILYIHSRYASEEFTWKSASLKKSIREAKSLLMN